MPWRPVSWTPSTPCLFSLPVGPSVCLQRSEWRSPHLLLRGPPRAGVSKGVTASERQPNDPNICLPDPESKVLTSPGAAPSPSGSSSCCLWCILQCPLSPLGRGPACAASDLEECRPGLVSCPSLNPNMETSFSPSLAPWGP